MERAQEAYEIEIHIEDLEKIKATLDEYVRYQTTLKQFRRRELYLWDEVSIDSVDPICEMITTYNRQDKNIPPENRTPIYLHIFSNGGNVFAGNALRDLVLDSKTPIYTVNDGLAASMGGVIFIAGKKRYAYPHSILMLHDGTISIEGDAMKVEDFTDFNKIARARDQKDVLSQAYGKLEKEEYEKHTRADWYMFADYAKKIGLVDYIIGEDCDIDDVLPTEETKNNHKEGDTL